MESSPEVEPSFKLGLADAVLYFGMSTGRNPIQVRFVVKIIFLILYRFVTRSMLTVSDCHCSYTEMS